MPDSTCESQIIVPEIHFRQFSLTYSYLFHVTSHPRPPPTSSFLTQQFSPNLSSLQLCNSKFLNGLTRTKSSCFVANLHRRNGQRSEIDFFKANGLAILFETEDTYRKILVAHKDTATVEKIMNTWPRYHPCVRQGLISDVASVNNTTTKSIKSACAAH